MKKDLQNGRSMIEMLGVLAIIGILTVGGFSLVSKTVTENKINKVIDEISDLARRTRIIFREYVYEKQPTSGADMTEYVHDAKAYPDSLDYGSKKFTNNEDLDITVTYRKISDVGYYVIAISDNSSDKKIPEDICMGLVNARWGSSASNGFTAISFDKVESSLPTTKTISLDTAAANCGTKQSIYLVFR